MLNKSAVILIGAILLVPAAPAHETPTASANTAPAGGATEPLYDTLGDLGYAVSTTSELAQRYFNQGLRWTYAFNHAAAARAFREAQRQDPECAMCYWGEAFVLGPNINAPMGEEAANPAMTAVTRAAQLAHHAKPSEQALIAALAKRYSNDPSAERAPLDQAYAAAMAEAAKRFPADPEIAVLTVDALMNLSPWDYWEADGVTAKGRIGEAIAMAENVLANHPSHPGAIHLYIHLTEASATPERAEPYADRLADLMPGAGHLVHMGTHTYLQVGRYFDSVELNKRAVVADETYLTSAKNTDAAGLYAYGYYPHNIHFVVASAQMIGDGATTFEYLQRLAGKIPDEISASIGWIQVIKTTPYYAHAQLSDPKTILALADPGDQFPLVKAMWHYARGVACAALGDLDMARAESARIAELNSTADFEMLLAWAVPAPDLLILAQHVVEGRIAQAEGDHDKAVNEFEIAAEIQDSLAYMEPPYWYYPVRQSLGAALIAAGKPADAEQAFTRSLEDFPGNGWALFGLMKAQEALGKHASAAVTKARFLDTWAGNPESLLLRQL